MKARELIVRPDGTALVPLGRSGTVFAVIDVEDIPLASGRNWCKDGNNYACTNEWSQGRYVTVRLHCLINKTPKGFDTDHINGIEQDNRRANLRTAMHSQNLANQAPPCGRRFKGTQAHRNKWTARIKLCGKYVYLGSFGTEVEAAEAYNAAAIKHYGAFARLNKIYNKQECTRANI